MRRIDAHVHYAGDHADCIEFLDRTNLKLLNVCVAHDTSGTWRAGAETFRLLAEQHPEQYAWCTTFDPPDFADRGYADRVIKGLERDLNAGAAACKIWKNVGMQITRHDGTFLMVDDPLFDPIYAYLSDRGTTLLMHIGEPLACWQPLDPQALHYGYYSNHPEWHLYGRSEYPSHQDLMDARDHVLAKHPGLRAVGAHLGSLEHDVTEVARRLEHYPNFAVDTSARLADLACQDREVVRQFFLRYQDRILFGTDFVQREPQSSLPDQTRREVLDRLGARYRSEFDYFEGDGQVEVRGRQVRGLGLPEKVLTKLYSENARAWYGL